MEEQLQEKIDLIATQLSRVKAHSSDLDDNQKRWLIVGICLHSIISPTLRKYVVPLLKALYTELIHYQKIDTQTYPTHLKRYKPTNAYLHYEAVNNNKGASGSQYDYKIKSVIDLSKLFLKPHMAQYTGFNESCDSSALLGLIININKFPAVVKSNANDVRDVRNHWAHCKFTEWDAVKYSESFQMMTNLVKSLSLSSTEESKILLEMNKWKLHGPSSLNGTNEICRLLHDLVESLKLVVKETDNNSLETKKSQEYCVTISSTLTQMKNDMETRLLEINKRLLVVEEKQDKLLDSHKVEIEFWKEQEVSFVDTPVVNVILRMLQSKENVLIVGEPGIGKSMIMHHVALEIQNKIDYSIIPCTRMQDILQHYRKDNNQMFVLDDICGRFTVSTSDIEHWINNEDKFNRILEKGNTLIAATCRLDIYKDDKFKKSLTVFKSNIFNLSEKYTREDKIKICRSYLSEADIQLLEDQNVYFTPLMCYLYSKNESCNLTEFLQWPFETYTKEWDKLKTFDPCKYCLLFVCVIYNGIIKKSLLYNEKNTKIKVDLGNIFEVCGIDRGTPRLKIKSTLDSLTGTYVRKTRNEYKVIHDQMFDFLCCYFGGKNDMVRCILRYADIRVFNQRTQLQSVDEQHSRFTIMISKKHQTKYFERVKSDVLHGKLNQCFNNTQMKNQVYRTSFLETLKSINDDIIIEQIDQRQTLRLNLTKSCNSIDRKECEDYVDDDASAAAAAADDDDKDDDYDEYDDDYDAYDHDEDDGDEEDDDDEDVDDDDEDVDDDDETYDDDNEQYLTKGPFIKSCLRGYYDIFEFFISKGDDIKNQDLLHTLLTAACKGGNEKIVQLLINKGSDVDGVGILGQTPLTAACKKGHKKIVQILLEKTSDINLADNEGHTPLTAASIAGHLEMVQLLIDHGSTVNQDGDMLRSPLNAACSEGHREIVELLINKGSKVNQVDCTCQTPLNAACSEGHCEIVNLLIAKKCDVNYVESRRQTALTTACSLGNLKLVEILINTGSDVNKVDGMGQTTMTAASSGGNEKIVKLLINKGCQVNQVDETGQLPLTTACSEGHEKIVQLLIDEGGDVNHDSGETPLTAACYVRNENIVNLLLDKGSKINHIDMWGQTPLISACGKGDKTLVELLIKKGSDIYQINGEGVSPLTAACCIGNERIVQFLIDKGCNVNKLDGLGYTPVTAACSGWNEGIVQLLIDKGSKVNELDGMRHTALTAACMHGNERIVQVLIDNGCDVDQFDGMGQTALTAACKGGNEKIVQILINKGCDVNQADKVNETPLSAAFKGQNINIRRMINDKVNEVNKAGGIGQIPQTPASGQENRM